VHHSHSAHGPENICAIGLEGFPKRNGGVQKQQNVANDGRRVFSGKDNRQKNAVAKMTVPQPNQSTCSIPWI
jgi:hypothetical protein